MTKRDSGKSACNSDKASGKQADRPAYLQRVFDGIPAQIDAIKAEREQAAKELRSFVRKLEQEEENKR